MCGAILSISNFSPEFGLEIYRSFNLFKTNFIAGLKILTVESFVLCSEMFAIKIHQRLLCVFLGNGVFIRADLWMRGGLTALSEVIKFPLDSPVADCIRIDFPPLSLIRDISVYLKSSLIGNSEIF